MSLDARLSPARVTVAAAAALPRGALFGLLGVYIAAGLFGRAPWVEDDAAGFGVMWTMAHGSLADWLLPNIVGLPVADGPLGAWIGALLIVALGPWLTDPLAARLGNVLWIVAGTAALWYATWRLTRERAAQPVAFAFGGEASPRDYGRMLADIAVLLVLATPGPLVRLHETTAAGAAFAICALALFGLAWSIERPRRGAVVAGLAVGALALTRGLAPAIGLLVGVSAALALIQPRSLRARTVALAALAAASVFLLWLLGTLATPAAARDAYFDAWRAGTWAAFVQPSGAATLRLLRDGAWFLWPLWPLALWTLYAWRHALRAPHMAVPLTVLGGLSATALTTHAGSDPTLLLLTPALVMLAALGATTLRRGADNLTDWLAILLYSALLLALWAYYGAMLAGLPAKMAASVARIAPGFEGYAGTFAVTLGAVATAAWITVVIWRLFLHPATMWRGPVLAASGLVALWALLTLLFTPLFNHGRSYATVGPQLARQMAATGNTGDCVQASNLAPSHRALFAFHAQVRFEPAAASQHCRWLLHRDSQRTAVDDEPVGSEWQPVWEAKGPSRQAETWRLYRRGQAR